MTPYLEVNNLSKRYDDSWALHHINLHIKKGEVFGLIGPSGAGKTTLLRLIATLEKPTEGTIRFDGIRLHGFSEKEALKMKRRMGIVFQNPVAFKRSVYENVAYGLRIRDVAKDSIDKRVKAALQLVGLSEFKQRKATTLSGGEVQRLALIRTTVIEPELLLLDEPTANLDPANVAVIERAISTIVRTEGTTVIVATHNMFQAERLADRVGFFLNGELIEVAATDQIFNAPKDKRTQAFVRGEMIY
ncbi:MAG: phosphate ABC transporter ATP-binding protein [Candidatus Bathyarchaeota archaeon]|nr:MAG: phosphate ABC transporter ATP-binding protein [Candidatus Bathyarchaeota archaeon]